MHPPSNQNPLTNFDQELDELEKRLATSLGKAWNEPAKDDLQQAVDFSQRSVPPPQPEALLTPPRDPVAESVVVELDAFESQLMRKGQNDAERSAILGVILQKRAEAKVEFRETLQRMKDQQEQKRAGRKAERQRKRKARR